METGLAEIQMSRAHTAQARTSDRRGTNVRRLHEQTLHHLELEASGAPVDSEEEHVLRGVLVAVEAVARMLKGRAIRGQRSAVPPLFALFATMPILQLTNFTAIMRLLIFSYL